MIEPISGFLGKLFGPSTEELGGWGGDIIAFRRWQSRVKMLKKAEQVIDDASLEAHELPRRVLMPILEGVADEDDSEMQDRWANLLANAATSDSDSPVAFPEVLRQLEPTEARMLDIVYRSLMPIAPEIRKVNLGVMGLGFMEELGLDQDAVEYHVDNLLRLRLVKPVLVQPPTGSDVLALTEFGRRFVRSCMPPGTPDPHIRFTDAVEVQKPATANRLARESRARGPRPRLRVPMPQHRNS